MKTQFLVALILVLPHLAQAQSNNDVYVTEAKKIVERLAGTKVPSDHPLLIEATAALRRGDRLAAAQAATKHPGFLNTTVKLMALKMSTREETIRLLLNDFAASFIGVVRDNLSAKELLTGNFHYVGDPAQYMTIRGEANIAEDDLEFVQNNKHYTNLEHSKIDIGQILVRREGQKVIGREEVNGEGKLYIASNPDPAGVLTSRTFMTEHAEAGTNRRIVEYAFREFMCVPLEEWADTSVTDAWVGRDIDRFPGGDHQKYLTSCKSCHTVMDSFRGAFAKWNSADGGAVHSMRRVGDGAFNAQGIADKVLKNRTVFPGGYEIKSDAFVNNARGPANEALFGWRDNATGGVGARGVGSTIANSRRFSQCMVKRVYDSVCRANLQMGSDLAFIQPIADKFEKGGYKLKALYEGIAVLPSCLGSKEAR